MTRPARLAWLAMAILAVCVIPQRLSEISEARMAHLVQAEAKTIELVALAATDIKEIRRNE